MDEPDLIPRTEKGNSWPSPPYTCFEETKK